jgi:hypothetical protein
LLATHPVGAAPPTFVLLAPMHLHAARLASRQDATIGLRLLEEQDRTFWNAEPWSSARRGLRVRLTEMSSRASTPKPASPPSIPSFGRSGADNSAVSCSAAIAAEATTQPAFLKGD